jgi:hypothetical protein
MFLTEVVMVGVITLYFAFAIITFLRLLSKYMDKEHDE